MKNVLYVNKPKGITSFDVCYKLRKIFNTKKIGHTGTLDPNATGVMVVLLDKATKANQFLVTSTKEYIASVEIGFETDTLDIDGNIINRKECLMPSSDILENVFKSFIGKSMQKPPLTSAIKINGKKLYQYQREGKEVEIPEREIEIYSIDLLDINEQTFTFKVLVSSGTYIRSLVSDILIKLNIIGTLIELQRTKVDNVTIDMCNSLDEIINNNYTLYDLYEVLSNKYETIELKDARLAINGRPLNLNTKTDRVLILSNKECIAIYERDGDCYRCVRGLF